MEGTMLEIRAKQERRVHSAAVEGAEEYAQQYCTPVKGISCL
jgi:hypothetical protein